MTHTCMYTYVYVWFIYVYIVQRIHRLCWIMRFHKSITSCAQMIQGGGLIDVMSLSPFVMEVSGVFIDFGFQWWPSWMKKLQHFGYVSSVNADHNNLVSFVRRHQLTQVNELIACNWQSCGCLLVCMRITSCAFVICWVKRPGHCQLRPDKQSEGMNAAARHSWGILVRGWCFCDRELNAAARHSCHPTRFVGAQARTS